MRFAAILLGLLFCTPALPQVAVARLTSEPVLLPEEVAAAEAKIAAHPDDLNMRMRLLTHYQDTAPVPSYDDPVKRSARLGHILYLIEHNANVIYPAAPLFYVPRSGRPYANVGDHDIVRTLLMHLAESNSEDAKVVLNAAWFLFIEDKQQAEDLLQRAVERNASDQRLAANLGFLYAMEILGLDGWFENFAATGSSERSAARQRSLSILESTTNAAVLAGAATAIPNLAMRASSGGQVDPELFQLSSKLMVNARALAPNDPAFHSAMPMIEYFQAAQGILNSTIPGVPARIYAPSMWSGGARGGVLSSQLSEGTPSRIRIGGNVQKAQLLEAPEPKYPAEAKASGISDDVRFDATIAPDGTVSALTLRSGHPLLVQSAVDAVKQWRYKPTILNGKPVEVNTEIVVSFPPK